MSYYIIIPAHNEEAYLPLTLDTIQKQSLLPKKVIIVNDNSNDQTEEIINSYVKKSNLFLKLNTNSTEEHLPGSKVIKAFNKGLSVVNEDFDFIVKLDADLILPYDYFETIADAFSRNPFVGIVGGFIYEKNINGNWVLNHPMNKIHVRGAFKAYSKKCFKAIGGLKPAMGWDTLDELLAQYHEYRILTIEDLKVKHLRPTGNAYNTKAKLLQGQAMYGMGYGFWLTVIASLKMASKQKSSKTFIHNLKGFIKAKQEGQPLLVNKEEAAFIKNLRWRGITNKIQGKI